MMEKRYIKIFPEALEIVGQSYAKDKFKGTDNNIAVTKTVDNKLQVSLKWRTYRNEIICWNKQMLKETNRH